MFATKPKPTHPSARPLEFPVSLDLRSYPEYAVPAQKLDDLKADLRGVEARMNDIQFELANQSVSVDEQARAILDGRAAREDRSADLHAEYRELVARSKVLKRAVELQTSAEAEACSRVSREIAGKVRPVYVAHLERMAALAAELGRMADAEQAFRDEMIRARIQFSGWLPAQPFREMQLADPNSRVRLWLRRLHEAYDVDPFAEGEV